MNEKEKIRGILQEIAGDFDTLADEYEQRIAEYEDALDSVKDAISELEAAEDIEDIEEFERPYEVMTDILMEQDDFEDLIETALPNGVHEGEKLDNTLLKDVVLSVQKMQEMKDKLQADMSKSDGESIKENMILCRDLLETALIQTKADYHKLLKNMERIGSIWKLTE